jgi:Na+/proline symporter
MLIPLGWNSVGGFDGKRASLDSVKLSLATPSGIGPWFIFMLTLNGLIGIVAQPHMMAAVGSGKNEQACRQGFLYGTFVKRFCTIGWAIVGLMVAAMVMRGAFGVHALHDPEEAFGFACRHILFPGGVGLLIACVLASNMAACSAFMVDSGALFTQNFYRKYLKPNEKDKHYLLVGRVSGLAITLGGVLYAVFLIQRVLNSFLLTETMATFMGISILGGMFWRRGNRYGAFSSLAVAMITNFVVYRMRGQRLDHWDPNVFLVALLAGTATFIVVSLLTPREPEKALSSFYGRLSTPAMGGDEAELEAASSDQADYEGAKAGRQLILVNLLRLGQGAHGFGFFHAYKEDLSGFVKGWAMAAVMVALAWVVIRL